ncbi:hypothetical protein BCR36DRAFT_584735 [Piromyces finnis]|uniref:Uncharacterized protein n=1 Tax=Piromyces finnis TaxID=1754191 RepID=A0A1Y1V6D4_9FUNG|nr:hypothetical protein BCR36DRAFT_584735 [Piromyces finnis]|eukprot:ORX47629.1 hypothetical protein BCR36DRAFT_584735 [Piromyces finnis]
MSSNNNENTKKVDNKMNQDIKEPENKSFLKNIIDSVLETGINKNIHNIARGVFVAAILSALTLVFISGFNIHTIVLTFLLIGLFASVELFNSQLNEIKKEAEKENKEKPEDKKNE